MSNDFQFNPTQVVPQTSVEVTREPQQYRDAKSKTDAARITSAKARAMHMCKDSNPVGGQYGFEYPPSYYEDFAGPNTSEYEFKHLLFILYFLHDPKFIKASLNYDGGYNSLTGVWIRGTSQISIQDLNVAVAERIAELGITEVLLLEYLAVPHGIAEYQHFGHLSFEKRMERFLRGEPLLRLSSGTNLPVWPMLPVLPSDGREPLPTAERDDKSREKS